MSPTIYTNTSETTPRVLRNWPPFQAGGPLFGVRRSGGSEAAQSYPGEFVSGNYFTMFGIRAYAGRAAGRRGRSSRRSAGGGHELSLMAAKYGSDPSVIGGVFNLNDKPFTVVGITPPGFFGDTLRDTPPDFFLPLNTEPWWSAMPISISRQPHWLDLIGRIRPGAAPASIEADMRVELKQWLRSHWDDMNANDRAKFPEQTLFLRPGGAGITGMREEYEHWLQILMMVSGFVLLIVCANVANLMLVRGMERRRQTSLSMALGAQASRLVRAGPHRKHLAVARRGRGGSGGRICRYPPDSAFCLPACCRHGKRAHQRVAVAAGAAVCLRRFAGYGDRLRHCSRLDGHTR